VSIDEGGEGLVPSVVAMTLSLDSRGVAVNPLSTFCTCSTALKIKPYVPMVIRNLNFASA